MYNIEYSQVGETGAFELSLPDQHRVPFVFSSPHSGRIYPKSFLDASVLDPVSIRKSEDFLIDELFHSVVNNGAPLLHANFARAYLDVNREAFELDPKMFSGKLPTYANTNSLRVAGGLGTVARIVAEHQEIYKGKLEVDEVLKRIDILYKPYHQALRELLTDTFSKFGYCVLIDCHSMPSAPSSKSYGRRDGRPDFIIGDRFGSSAASEIVNLSTEILRGMGYRVEINRPYAGGYITQYYGRPKEGVHAMQIEINRGLYMDEDAIVANNGFDQLNSNLAEFVRQLVLLCPVELGGQLPLAAE